MIYYVSKVFWLIAAPTNALVLISAIAALWAVLRGSKCAAWLAAAAACELVIGAFTAIGLALQVPLENSVFLRETKATSPIVFDPRRSKRSQEHSA
jgi:hypothetical protein